MFVPRRVGYDGKLLDRRVLVTALVTRRPGKSIVAGGWRRGTPGKRIAGGRRTAPGRDLLRFVRIPSRRRLPDDALELLSHTRQKVFHGNLVHTRRSEIRRRDEDRGVRVELFGDIQKAPQRRFRHLPLAEPLLTDFAWSQQRELESRRRFATPPADRSGPRLRQVRFLNLDEQKLLEEPRRRDRKTGAPDRNHGRWESSTSNAKAELLRSGKDHVG